MSFRFRTHAAFPGCETSQTTITTTPGAMVVVRVAMVTATEAMRAAAVAPEGVVMVKVMVMVVVAMGWRLQLR